MSETFDMEVERVCVCVHQETNTMSLVWIFSLALQNNDLRALTVQECVAYS